MDHVDTKLAVIAIAALASLPVVMKFGIHKMFESQALGELVTLFS